MKSKHPGSATGTALQRGFTLIELVIVIVIIGILAAVAIPQFANLSDDANDAALNGIAGAWASASATNIAACKGGLSSCSATTIGCTTAYLNAMVPDTATDTAVTGATGTATKSCKVTKSGRSSKDVTVLSS